jgi:hypothetical protein
MRLLATRFAYRRPILGAGLLMALAVGGLVIFLALRDREPIGIRWAGWSQDFPGRNLLQVTNRTSRAILYRVAHMQVKRGETWSEFGRTYSPLEVSAIPIVRQPSGTRVVIWAWSSESLAAFSAGTHQVARPMYIGEIDRLDGATAWRMTVEWAYAGPTRFEILRNRILRFFSKSTNAPSPSWQTNFSPDIRL